MEHPLCGSYEIHWEEQPVGRLRVTREGLMLLFAASCRFPAGDPPVLRLYCRGGRTVFPVGIPAPDGESWTLRRRWSLSALAGAGLEHIESCFLSPSASAVPAETEPAAEAEPAEGAVWIPCDDLSSAFSQPELQNACRKVPGGLIRQENGLVRVAIPISSSRPFPMMPVFCFGRSLFLHGREYLEFCTKNGCLVE